MWCSSVWERKTETGCPSAAHTLLKFTPAAITRTVTSKAPGSGTSISSSWKASIGSPWRSSRITHAAIVAGSSPGSTSICATRLGSTATIWKLLVGAVDPIPQPTPGASEEVVALDPHDHAGDGGRGDGQTDAEGEEAQRAVDVADQPAEVHAEEAGEDGPDDEDRAGD